MRLERAVMVALLVGALGADCGNGEEDGVISVSEAGLVGTWQATSVQVINLADPMAPLLDLIMMGGSATLTITSNSRYTFVQMEAGGQPETSTGTLVVEPGVLIFNDDDFPGDPDAASFMLSGSTLTIFLFEGEFDFDDNGVDEPADITFVFQRDTT